MTPEFTPAQRDALKASRADDGIAAQLRLRALIALWRTEPELRTAAQRIALTDSATIDLRKGHRRYPVRLTLILDDADHEALLRARHEHTTEAAAVIRALVDLWMSDPGLQQRVLQVAQELRSRDARTRG